MCLAYSIIAFILRFSKVSFVSTSILYFIWIILEVSSILELALVSVLASSDLFLFSSLLNALRPFNSIA